jgi:hypothetical protein
VSSAILYLAIVAIWAFLLAPRWIRRSHTPFFASTESGGAGEAAGGLAEEDANHSADAPASRFGLLRSLGLISTESPEAPSGPVAPAGPSGPAGLSGPAGPDASWQDADREDEPEPDTAPLSPITVPPVPPALPALPALPAPVPPDTADVHPGPGASAGSEADGFAGPADQAAQPAGPVRTPVSRTKILQARRRLLTTLVLLAVAAASCTLLNLTSPWVCVPPAGMLGMYLLLLREAAIADAENARRAEAAHAARQRAQAKARARQEQAPHPSAEIIDISARLGDQLYDQYADATVRAVGD